MLIIQTKKYRYEINKIFFEQLAFFVCTLPIAGLFTLFYCKDTTVEQRATLELLSSFTGHRPFQYRILMPLLYNGIHAITGTSYNIIAIIFTFLTVIGIVYAFRALLQTVTNNKETHFWSYIIFLPIIFNYANFLSEQPVFYPYDLPAILFFSLALTSLLKNNYRLYYLYFILALLNRETGIVLGLGFLFINLKKMPAKKLFLHLAIQGLFFIAFRAVDQLVFRNNPGSLFELQFYENINELITYSPLWKQKAKVLFLSFGGLWMLAILRWNYLRPVTRTLLYIIPIFLEIMFVVGNMTELRIYSELVPLITLAAIDS